MPSPIRLQRRATATSPPMSISQALIRAADSHGRGGLRADHARRASCAGSASTRAPPLKAKASPDAAARHRRGAGAAHRRPAQPRWARCSRPWHSRIRWRAAAFALPRDCRTGAQSSPYHPAVRFPAAACCMTAIGFVSQLGFSRRFSAQAPSCPAAASATASSPAPAACRTASMRASMAASAPTTRPTRSPRTAPAWRRALGVAPERFLTPLSNPFARRGRGRDTVDGRRRGRAPMPS